jgi:hypothetical protein
MRSKHDRTMLERVVNRPICVSQFYFCENILIYSSVEPRVPIALSCERTHPNHPNSSALCAVTRSFILRATEHEDRAADTTAFNSEDE